MHRSFEAKVQRHVNLEVHKLQVQFEFEFEIETQVWAQTHKKGTTTSPGTSNCASTTASSGTK